MHTMPFLSLSHAIYMHSQRVSMCASYQFCVSASNLVRSHHFVSNNLCSFVNFSIGQLGRGPESPPVPALSPWGRGRHRQAQPWGERTHRQVDQCCEQPHDHRGHRPALPVRYFLVYIGCFLVFLWFFLFFSAPLPVFSTKLFGMLAKFDLFVCFAIIGSVIR